MESYLYSHTAKSIFSNQLKCIFSVVLAAFGIVIAYSGYRIFDIYELTIRNYELKIINEKYELQNELDFHDLEFEVLLCIYSCFLLSFFNFVSVWFKRPVYVCIYIPLCLGTATLLYFTTVHIEDHRLSIDLVEPRVCSNIKLKEKIEQDLTLMNADMCI